jgi:hypothetical protein
MKQKKPTKAIAKKVLKTVDCGLVSGLGVPKPGEMCIEAAVAFAMGEGHNDRPSCVGDAVRAFKITLNDAAWSSPTARAAGMRAIAIAQLGSNRIDQVEFAKLLALATVKILLPKTLRTLAALFEGAIKEALLGSAEKCSVVGDLSAAESAAKSAESAAKSAAWSAESAAKSAESAAESAAWSAESAAESAAAAWSAESAAWSAAWSAESAAESAAKSAESAAKSAAWAAESAARDSILRFAADMCLSVLKQLSSKGCEWLDLLEVSK